MGQSARWAAAEAGLDVDAETKGAAAARGAAAATVMRVLPLLMRRLVATWSAGQADQAHLAQWRVLQFLVRRDYRVMELARTIGVTPSTLTVTIDALVRRGLVERVREPGGDRRGVLLRLTEAGHAAYADKLALAQAHVARLLLDARPDEVQALRQGMEALERALNAEPRDDAEAPCNPHHLGEAPR